MPTPFLWYDCDEQTKRTKTKTIRRQKQNKHIFYVFMYGCQVYLMKNKKNMETESIFYAYCNSNGSKTVAPRKLPPRIITPPPPLDNYPLTIKFPSKRIASRKIPPKSTTSELAKTMPCLKLLSYTSTAT